MANELAITTELWTRARMHDLPSVYQGLMPASTDAAILTEAEKQIRQRFREEMIEPARAAMAAVDISKLSPRQLIEHGLRESRLAQEASMPVAPKALPAAMDFSKMSPLQLLQAGLAESRPAWRNRGPARD